MTNFYYIFSAILILVNVFSLTRFTHWVFRIWDFGRLQILALQIPTFLIGFFMVDDRSTLFWTFQGALLLFMIHNLIILIPFTPIYKRSSPPFNRKGLTSVSILSVNVYQFNKEHELLINLVKEVNPDIILTMESNGDWDKALSVLEADYPNFLKLPFENTYGMHFYTRLEVLSMKANFFIEDDLPSVEVEVISEDNRRFTFFGVHPPPPSPTEEEDSKERDAELLAVAKRVKEVNGPVIVVGDFNNVAWARSSVLFRKTSELIDPRVGRGLVSTYHAKYKLFRFPIDLFFHSTDIYVEEFKTLPPIDSDHLPLFCSFYIGEKSAKQEKEKETLDKGEGREVEEVIEEGKEKD